MKPLAIEAPDFSRLAQLLEAAGFDRLVRNHERVVLKPNLTDNLPHPVTTPPELIGAIACFVRDLQPNAEIIIAEGCGTQDKTTHDIFKSLGYHKVAAKTGARLLDLNDDTALRTRSSEKARFFRKIHLPSIAFEGLLVSIPVLKAHSMAKVTLALKNMLGLLPPAFYSIAGHWRKAYIHQELHRGIVELNMYRGPDFSILDATIGMAQAHLWGPRCEPPVGVLACGSDPVAIDALGAGLLGIDWRSVGHIREADGVLGSAADGEAILEKLGRRKP